MRVTFSPSGEARNVSEIPRTTIAFDTHTWEDRVDDLIDQVFYPALIAIGFHEKSIRDAFRDFGEEN